MYVERAWIGLYWVQQSYLPELLERGHQHLLFLKSTYTKEKAPRGALSYANYYLVSIATHDPEKGQEVSKDVVDV